MVTPNNIWDLLKYGEHLTLECKKATNKIPDSLWETYSAFANTVGGTILLGIEEKTKEDDFKKRFIISNIENPQARLKEFWDTINNSSKVNLNILRNSDVEICVIDEKNIIRIEVPQADYTQRPIFINNNPISGTYKRNNEGDYHCKESEIRAMYRDSSDDGNDGGLLEGYTMDDIDPETLKAYRNLFTTLNQDHVWNTVDDKSFLLNLGGYTVDRRTKAEGLTPAGLLMFGRGLSIRERFANIRMDFIDKTGISGDMRWSDRLTYDGMWENNLCNFIWTVVPKLTREIKRPFKLEGMIRIDDTPVHKAIRESMINMLIHSDYMISGVLKVIKNDKGFIFSNPGSLKLPIRRIYEGGNSKARNPRIQTMLRMIGYGDNAGSGFPTILDAWRREKWRQPNLYEDTELQQVDLKLYTIALMPKEATLFLTDLLGENTYKNLTLEEQIILGTAFLEHFVSNQRLQQILELHPTDIGKTLNELVEKNMLISNFKGRWTTYTINEDYKSNERHGLSLKSDKPIFKNETDKKIYDYICENGFITTKQVVANTEIATKQGARTALKRLITSGLVLKMGAGQDVRYVLSENNGATNGATKGAT
ncbi:MAG: putative DNA binding domain-containing protein, partial [Selenomonadaceae bacterium]|nr:putative DNA binding domain-containing protein [Selenomonadaceae bacterium]